MPRQPLVARRAEELLGSSVVATSPVAGGDIATATRLRLSSGQTALMKTLPHPPEGFFEAEAAGLRWLGEVQGGVPVPEVLGVASDCLVLAWIEQSPYFTRIIHLKFKAKDGRIESRITAAVMALEEQKRGS